MTIVRHRAAWNPQANSGVIDVQFDDGTSRRFDKLTAESFTAMLMMLDEEKPISVNDPWLVSGTAPMQGVLP